MIVTVNLRLILTITAVVILTMRMRRRIEEDPVGSLITQAPRQSPPRQKVHDIQGRAAVAVEIGRKVGILRPLTTTTTPLLRLIQVHDEGGAEVPPSMGNRSWLFNAKYDEFSII